MHIYSKTINIFIKRVRSLAKKIVAEEMGLPLKGSKFLFGKYYYPLHIVVFESPKNLGYFLLNSYEIGINKELFYKAKDSVLKEVLRHELAHFYTYLKYGADISAHGIEFRETCKEFGWGAEVYKEKLMVDKRNDEIEGELEKEKIISKIKKLMALSSSSNIHESQLAMAKANELLMKYNMERIDDQEEEVCAIKVLHSKKNNGKYRAIYEILKTFYISPVFNYGKSGFYLEIIGKRVNVLLGEYVAIYLDRELEHLWDLAKKENSDLRGVASKNSFFDGIAKGYVQKIKGNIPEGKYGELVKVESFLKEQLQLVYPRLGSSRSQSKHDRNSHQLGQKIGKGLHFNRPLEGKKTRFKRLIGLSS